MDAEELQIRYYPDDVLRKRCAPVRRVDDDVLRRARAMLDLMYVSDGVGLAGPQVGWSSRIITLDTEQAHEGERIFVNPRIVSREGAMELEEGCLSLPGIRLNVPRSEHVQVVAYTIMGQRVEVEAEGFAACAWQHELDHLNGVLIIDRVTPTALITVRDQLKQLERELASSQGSSK